MGVPRDKHRMMQWWRKAAIQGNVSANMPWVRPIKTATW
jgi:TPR repeat protein